MRPAPEGPPRQPAEARVTIVLADDHAVVRTGLRMLLDAVPGFEVVAEAGDVDSTLRLVARHRPSIVVLDVHMPRDSSLPAIPRLLDVSPQTRIVVLTAQDDLAYAREALHAGVHGYLLKEAADQQLIEAVHAAAGGETYLQPRLGARLARGEGASDRPGDDLTAREREVLRLIALGHTSAEIAQSLVISVRTVESHRASIQRKLGLAARADLVRYALEQGLVNL